MENRLCCLLRRLVAFTFRRLYKPPPFKHMTNSIPNGNLSCLIQRKNNKYRAIFITKLTKQGKTQNSSWKAAPHSELDSERPAFLRTPGWVGRIHQIKFYTFCKFCDNSYLCRVKKLSTIISPIATELAQFEVFFEQTMKAETEPMDDIMRYVQESRGKRLRPILVLLSAKLFGEVNERTLRAATFVEMMHSATLIHDDVVDDADQRRGKASVKAQFGNHSAVLAGDYLLAKAMLLLSQPDEYNILQEMLRTAAAMSEGELLQNASRSLSLSKGRDKKVESSIGRPFDPSTSSGLRDLNYLDIIIRKTATLLRACCVIGAFSVNATHEQVQQMADFGLNFGILFQLRDDMIDGENVEQAQALLPVYYEKTMKALEGFPPSETTEALRDLTVFCAEREE